MKEWAYAGFAFDFIFASISNVGVDGLSFMAFFPLIFLAILSCLISHMKKLFMAKVTVQILVINISAMAQ